MIGEGVPSMLLLDFDEEVDEVESYLSNGGEPVEESERSLPN